MTRLPALAHEVALYVEYEFTLAQLFECQVRIECGLLFDLVGTAGPPNGGKGGIECKECGGCAHCRNEEIAAAHSKALRICAGGFVSKRIGMTMYRQERN